MDHRDAGHARLPVSIRCREGRTAEPVAQVVKFSIYDVVSIRCREGRTAEQLSIMFNSELHMEFVSIRCREGRTAEHGDMIASGLALLFLFAVARGVQRNSFLRQREHRRREVSIRCREGRSAERRLPPTTPSR